MIVVGLCFDGGQSLASKIFNSRVMQVKDNINKTPFRSIPQKLFSIFQLSGRISMALYLSHELVIYWINWAIYGMYNWHSMHRIIRLPMWAVPIHIVISLILAVLLTRFLEDPMRRWLKQEGKERRNWIIFFTTIISVIAVIGTILGVLFHGGYVV